MKLYLNEKPRTFVLVSDVNYALFIRHPRPKYRDNNHHHHFHHSQSETNNDSNLSDKAIVEFVKADLINLSGYKEVTCPNKEFLGFLGFLNMKSNIYLGFISKHKKVATPKVGENINVITGVEFYCLNSDAFDHLLDKHDDMHPDQHLHSQADKERIRSEYPAASVRKFLCSGDFFYSSQFDVTSNIQERGFHETGAGDPTSVDKNNSSREQTPFRLYADSPYFQRFMWNGFMNSELITFTRSLTPFESDMFDRSGFITTITRGYAKTVNTTVQNYDDALLTIINKQSCIKNGPLFGDWGSDDKGAVSNFQESEVIIYTQNYCFAYVIVKGNVPTFWELDNHSSKRTMYIKANNKNIVFPRSFDASQHAFQRHFDRLVGQYGDVRIIKSMPDDPDNYKSVLGKTLIQHINAFNKKRAQDEDVDNEIDNDNEKGELNYHLDYIDMPLKASTLKRYGYTSSNPYALVQLVVDSIIDFGALFYDISSKSYRGKQLGVFRITTFNSLSKAIFLSKIVSHEVIELAFRDIGIQVDNDLYMKHAKLWAECDEFANRNIVNFVSHSSKLQGSSATSTKKTFKSKVSKKYLSSMVDPKSNETSMLKLLGRLQDQVSVTLHNPIHDYLNKELNKRSKLFTSSKNINLFASTFNVNGSLYEESIRDWLFPRPHRTKKSYDLVLIGLQEVVELSPGQMVNTQSENLKNWERKIKSTLNKYNPENFKYVSLWTEQLGGIGLLLFVKSSEIQNVSNVEGSIRKTGFRGVSANKGGVAVRFHYENTEFCFLVSHLAAGLANVDERHHDYKVLSKRVKFSKNRRVKDHDAVIWLGDLNYRIGTLTNEQVKYLIEQGSFSKLFEYDQLNQQMAKGESFPFFDEKEITFPPTYKFDNGTKIYDTSEKQRIPAWTDRILSLSRNKIIKQLYYDSNQELIFSDHRPVLAEFSIKIDTENETLKKNLANEIYETYRKKFSGKNDLFLNNGDLSYLINDKTLPPPSSDINKWWLEGGLPARISIPELSGNSDKVINPRLPKNPFESTDEPQFITKNQLMSLVKQTH